MARIPMADKKSKKYYEDFKEEVNRYRIELALDYKIDYNDSTKDRTDKDALEKILLKYKIIGSAEIGIKENEWEDHGYGDGHINCKLSLYIKEDLYLEIGDRVYRKTLAEEIQEDFKGIELSNDRYITNVIIRLLDEGLSKQVSQANIIVLDKDLKTIWQDTSYFKLFISHRAKYKEEVSELKEHLWNYGISCFVAHEDIEPSELWIEELKKALHSMDALLAYITDDFSGDKNDDKDNFGGVWTNQEVGFAAAKNTPIIPVKCGKIDPTGFMLNTQASRISKQGLPKLADDIYKIILKKFKNDHEVIRKFKEFQTKKESKAKEEILSNFKNSPNYNYTDKFFDKLKTIKNFSDGEIEMLMEAYNENRQISDTNRMRSEFLNFLNKMGGDNYEQSGSTIRRKKDN